MGLIQHLLLHDRYKEFFVIPAKAGIQRFQSIINSLDPGFRRGDDIFQGIFI